MSQNSRSGSDRNKFKENMTYLYALGGIPINPFAASSPVLGLYSLRCTCSWSSTPRVCAVVKDWIAIAVKPLVVDAKHIFNPLAGPMSLAMCLMLRTLARCAPLKGALSRLWGPETTRLGLDQLPSGWILGGPPMIFHVVQNTEHDQ